MPTNNTVRTKSTTTTASPPASTSPQHPASVQAPAPVEPKPVPADSPAQSKPRSTRILERLGVYGFNKVETLILAALVTADPLLLIGRSGTGKTFLLNSLSEALGFIHRHLNAALVAFDDLMGFPYPAKDGETVTFLQTAASIWPAQSILIDEISRARPEVQNKFFSIIHEMRLHGIRLKELVYRWAAMNPPSLGFDHDASDDAQEEYAGSEPLDAALADRFAFLVSVPDWDELSIEEQLRVVNPAGEGVISSDDGHLAQLIAEARERFQRRLPNLEPELMDYVRRLTTLLGQAGVRISPRRSRMIARNIAAVLSTAEVQLGVERIGIGSPELHELLRTTVESSLPQRASGIPIAETLLDSAHAEAFRGSLQGDEARWLSELALTADPAQKVLNLLNSDVNTDLRSLGLLQMLSTRDALQRALIVLSVAPLVYEPGLFNDEARNALGRWIPEVFLVDGLQDEPLTLGQSAATDDIMKSCRELVKTVRRTDPKAAKRLNQLFHYLQLKGHTTFKASVARRMLDECMSASAEWAASRGLVSTALKDAAHPTPKPSN